MTGHREAMLRPWLGRWVVIGCLARGMTPTCIGWVGVNRICDSMRNITRERDDVVGRDDGSANVWRVGLRGAASPLRPALLTDPLAWTSSRARSVKCSTRTSAPASSTRHDPGSEAIGRCGEQPPCLANVPVPFSSLHPGSSAGRGCPRAGNQRTAGPPDLSRSHRRALVAALGRVLRAEATRPRSGCCRGGSSGRYAV
jgi:hypothetical protein